MYVCVCVCVCVCVYYTDYTYSTSCVYEWDIDFNDELEFSKSYVTEQYIFNLRSARFRNYNIYIIMVLSYIHV